MRAATSGTCSTGSATSRPSRRGSSRASANGGSSRGARSPTRCGSSAGPASRDGSTPRSRRTWRSRDRRERSPTSTVTGPIQQPIPAAPPRWKQAVTIWLGFFPTNLLASWLLGFVPGFAEWPLVLRVLFATLALTPVMTYLVLPVGDADAASLAAADRLSRARRAACRRASPLAAVLHWRHEHGLRRLARRSLTVAHPPPTLRVESAAVYLALVAGAIGAVYGLIIALIYPDLPLRGEWSFGIFAAIGSSVIAAVISAVGYWRSRHRPGQEWRRSLPPWKFTVNTISVVIVHTALAFLATYVVFLVLSLGFVGLPVVTFWAVVLDGRDARDDGLHRVPLGRRA